MNVATLWTSLAAVAVYGSLTTAAVAAPGPSAPAPTTDQRAARGQDTEPAARRPPNVVLITADDMMASDLAVMPHTRRLLARRGTTFTQGIAPTPLCVPSRVSMLTGQYAHNHGVRAVSGPKGGFNAFSGGRDANTLPVWLRRGGYSTLHVGRYLNGYGDTIRSAHYVPGRLERLAHHRPRHVLLHRNQVHPQRRQDHPTSRVLHRPHRRIHPRHAEPAAPAGTQEAVLPLGQLRRPAPRREARE